MRGTRGLPGSREGMDRPLPGRGRLRTVHTAPIIEGAGEGNAGTNRRCKKPELGIDRTRAAKQHFCPLKWPTAHCPTQNGLRFLTVGRCNAGRGCDAYFRSGLDPPVIEIAFDPDRSHRMHRADVFAGTAAGAAFRVDSQLFCPLIWAHQTQGIRRADARTGRTLHLVRIDDATCPVEDGAPDLGCAFPGRGDGPDRAGGADFGTGHTVHATKAAFEGKRRLEHARAVSRAAENLIGTGRHAQLAARAVRRECRQAGRSRRRDRDRADRALLAGEVRQLGFLEFLCGKNRSADQTQAKGEKRSAGRSGRLEAWLSEAPHCFPAKA